MTKKTILITGINGFLGSHLAKALCRDYHVIGLEYSLENLFRLKSVNVKVYRSDENFEHLFVENKIFAIIHAATVYLRHGEPVSMLLNTNMALPIKLYELANKHHVRKFLNTDSFFTDHPGYRYLSSYILSKQQVLEWFKMIPGNCRFFNMKLFHLYGTGDSPDKFIPQMIARLKSNSEFLDVTQGQQRRDFIFIDDVVEAFKTVLEKEIDHPAGIIEFEIGSGASVSVKEVLELMKRMTASSTNIRFGVLPYRENEIMDAVADIRNLQDLGWKHNYPLAEGLKKTIETQSQ
jgi:CDP-paratose synthetase